MAAKIFLAHAREDRAQVRELYTDLKARGFDPWLDAVDLMPGQMWKTEIPKAIRQAGVFLACLSSQSVGKVGYVQNEFRLALAAFGVRPPGSIFLIPVRLDECEIPDLQIPDLGLNLRDIHWVDLWEKDGFDRLVRAIDHALGAGESQPKAVTVLRDVNELWCPELVVIPPGKFMMGYGKNGQHEVQIAYRFAVGRYPVTFEEYACFAEPARGKLPPDEGWGRGRRPVINVSWEDAKEYVKWLSKETDQPYRLLSEAEWEYAARAGTTALYWWGDGLTLEKANCDSNVGRTTEVGCYPPNPWGLYDMNGNVWEWLEDCWNESYEGAPTDGSAWAHGDCSRRVWRGGCWFSRPWILHSAYRYRSNSNDRDYLVGFRVARTLR